MVLSVGCSPPKPLAHPLAGIIATSPFVAQTHPVNKIVRGAGGVFASILPWVSIKTAVKPEVSWYRPIVPWIVANCWFRICHTTRKWAKNTRKTLMSSSTRPSEQ